MVKEITKYKTEGALGWGFDCESKEWAERHEKIENVTSELMEEFKALAKKKGFKVTTINAHSYAGGARIELVIEDPSERPKSE